LGDLNYDSAKAGPNDDGSLGPLLQHPDLTDPFDKLDAKERWTHFYESGKEVSRLDYILLDKRLKMVGKPAIVRKGLSIKCKQYTGPRYPTVGPKNTEASDHCPVTVVLEV
jgi:endonuclease/exonuclease/phosphatase family metal-dependent hydrolase